MNIKIILCFLIINYSESLKIWKKINIRRHRSFIKNRSTRVRNDQDRDNLESIHEKNSLELFHEKDNLELLHEKDVEKLIPNEEKKEESSVMNVIDDSEYNLLSLIVSCIIFSVLLFFYSLTQFVRLLEFVYIVLNPYLDLKNEVSSDIEEYEE